MKLHDLKEARHIGPGTRKIKGELFFDNRLEDEYHYAANVTVTFRVTDPDANPGDINAVVTDVKSASKKGYRLLKTIGISTGTEATYQNDSHGEMLFGWFGQSPWTVEPK